MSYRDELEAARARIALLEDDLARAKKEAARKKPPDLRQRRRWTDLAISAAAGLLLAAVSTTVAALRGAEAWQQVLQLFTTLVGAGLIVALGVLMIADARPLADPEERKKRRWGCFLVVAGLGFELWRSLAMPY